MPSRNQSRSEIPASSGNNLYFVDRTLVQFARSFEPAQRMSTSSNRTNGSENRYCSTTSTHENSQRNER